MEKIRNIDALGLGRPTLSDREREQQLLEKNQQQKEEGYQQLVELCALGEYEVAKQLANRHPNWGYEVVDGVVMERIN
jgi:hypothetical protein